MARAPRKLAVNNPYFKLLLWIIVALCAATLLTMIALAFFGTDESRFQQMLMSTCEKIFTVAAGALVGLLGGKAGSGA